MKIAPFKDTAFHQGHLAQKKNDAALMIGAYRALPITGGLWSKRPYDSCGLAWAYNRFVGNVQNADLLDGVCRAL
jgi:hypothetical protein